MNAVLFLSAENGMLVLEASYASGIGGRIPPCSTLQLSSMIYATYQLSQFDLSGSNANSSALTSLTMGQVQVSVERIKCLLGDILLVVIMDMKLSRPLSSSLSLSIRKMLEGMDTEKTKGAQQKELQKSLDGCYSIQLASLMKSLQEKSGFFAHRKVLLISRCAPPVTRTASSSGASSSSARYANIDFQLGGVRKPAPSSPAPSPQHATNTRTASRRNKKPPTSFVGSLVACLCCCFTPPPQKRNSIHPSPGKADGSPLHTSRLLCQYLDCAIDASATAAAHGASLAAAKLTGEVVLALLESQSATTGAGFCHTADEVRYFRYNPHSREVNREFPKQPQPLVIAGSGTGVGHVHSAMEIRAAAGPPGATSNDPSGSRAPARTRSTIVSLMKAGYTAARRGSTALARPAAAPAAAESTSALLDVLHFPELQIVIICKSTAAEAATGIPGGVDLSSQDLWDFLLFAKSCLEYKLLSAVQELPVDN